MPSSFCFFNGPIQSQCVIRDLGVLLIDQLTMRAHISDICKRAFYQLRLVHQVRPFITEEAAKQLVKANVTSLLDYCNALLIGMPSKIVSLRSPARAEKEWKGNWPQPNPSPDICGGNS